MLSTGRSNACNYFNHHASNGGIPSGSDEKTFKTVVVLKKSSVIANCTSQSDAIQSQTPTVKDTNFPLTRSRRKDIDGLTISGELLR